MEIDETPPRSRSEEIYASARTGEIWKWSWIILGRITATYVTKQYVTQQYVTKQQKEQQHLEQIPEATLDSEQTHHQLQPDLKEESHTNGHVGYTNVMHVYMYI